MTTNRHFCHCKTLKNLTAMRVSKNEKHFLKNLFLFQLKDNCFIEFCCFLSDINMNQLQVYIYLLPLEPPSHLPPHPNLEGCLTENNKIMNEYRVIARIYHQRRQWHPTPVLLPGESHGQRSLVGCSPWGHTESDSTEATQQQQQQKQDILWK